jgi:hypothetical protein
MFLLLKKGGVHGSYYIKGIHGSQHELATGNASLCIGLRSSVSFTVLGRRHRSTESERGRL